MQDAPIAACGRHICLDTGSLSSGHHQPTLSQNVDTAVESAHSGTQMQHNSAMTLVLLNMNMHEVRVFMIHLMENGFPCLQALLKEYSNSVNSWTTLLLAEENTLRISLPRFPNKDNGSILVHGGCTTVWRPVLPSSSVLKCTDALMARY
ncbi:hypothetical protein ZHAS_00010941 [Anopheles sinensis]|uniref:Uncharacterized protein n=1 Tax=Anopheles sinensis TaxID=74873 RepID=A0A084VYX4_ANOSI|nr:hypothetical protein ZHAS_00010941 [Anopheles sinensis]